MNKDRFIKRIKLSQEILQKIAKIDECKGRWHGGLRLSPQILGNLKRTVIITSAGASTRIEGARMDDDEIARLLRGLKTQSPRNRDEQEVAGYADLIGRIFDHWQSLKLTEGQILQFHCVLLRFSKKDQQHKGFYKKADNVVVARTSAGVQKILFRPTPPYLVKKEMDDILYWTSDQLSKGALHHLLIILNFVFELLAIHPFEDGNGRLSRALTNLLLLKSGYSYVPYVSLEKIIEDHVSEYYLSLRAAQKNHKSAYEDITPWVNFSLDMLIMQANQAMALMEKAQPEKLFSEKQRMIFELFKPREELSVAEIYQALDNKISRPTVKQVLSKLVMLKVLERIGQGRASRYRLFMANS